MVSPKKLAKPLARRTFHGLGLPLGRAAPRVLIYHSVDDIDSPISVSEALFTAQMDYLVAKGYRTWTAGQMVQTMSAGDKIPADVVVITFDDGYLNNVTRALPILEQRGLCATVFMVTQNDGALPRWGERDKARIKAMVDDVYTGSAADKQDAYDRTLATLAEPIATWEQLRGAPERGLEIASHTRTHPYMDEVDDDQLRDELEGSRHDLAEQGFGDCVVMAWPYGAHNDRVIAAAKAAGYQGTFLAEPSWQHRNHDDPMRIARCSIDPDQGTFGMAFQLGRGHDLWTWLREKKRG